MASRVFLVRDNRVLNGPLGRSLCSFARTTHSGHSLFSARFARCPFMGSLTPVAHSLLGQLKFMNMCSSCKFIHREETRFQCCHWKHTLTEQGRIVFSEHCCSCPPTLKPHSFTPLVLLPLPTCKRLITGPVSGLVLADRQCFRWGSLYRFISLGISIELFFYFATIKQKEVKIILVFVTETF